MTRFQRNKKYSIIPPVIIMLAFGILLMLGSTATAPFIYTLFYRGLGCC
jgi:uncharacterized membrane protein YraQ (UPF0718 family)